MTTAGEVKLRFSSGQLREIAWGGTPLFERPAVSGEDSSATTDSRVWAEWMNILGLETRAELAQRLALDGTTTDTLTTLATKRGWPGDVAMPPWVEALQEIVSEFGPNSDSWEDDPARKPGDPQPFEDVILPFVRYARARSNAVADYSLDMWQPAARAALERHLLIRLCSLSALALGRTFHLFRALRQMEPDRIPSSNPRHHRDAFLSSLSSGGLVTLLVEYPSLARLVTVTTLSWIDMVRKLRERLCQDLDAITDRFFAGVQPGPVADVRPGLSDPHHGQQSVCVLGFACGREIVYKPRSLAPDWGFHVLQHWLNKTGRAPSLFTPQILDRETHGWMEYICPAPCADLGEIAAYYERAGALLCLAYITQATDLHCENLLACRHQPVLIDLETAIHPLLRPLAPDAGAAADLLADDIWAQSVARTGLLPEWESGRNGRSFDVGGLGADQDQVTGYLHPAWSEADTDEVRLFWREGVVKAANNLPILEGRRFPLHGHADALIRGFTAAYRACQDHQKLLLLPDGPLALLLAAQVRFVFRPTRQYLELLSRLRHPEFLRDGVARCLEIERLVPALQDPSSGAIVPGHWGIYVRERTAIEQLDVPHFSVYPDTRDVTDAGVVAAREFLEASTRDLVQSSIARLCEEDLQRQQDYLQALLHAHRHELNPSPVKPAERRPSDAAPVRLDNATLVAEASRIADQICHSAIRAGDGSVSWICLTSSAETGRLRVQPMGHKLYSGRVGVALFLAVSATLGHEDHQDLVRAALLPLRSLARRSKLLRRFADTVSLGMGDGLSGMIYGLVRIGRWLGEAAILEDAALLGSMLTDDRLSAGSEVDVISGQAGAILGLSCLFEATGEQGLLDKVRTCAERLLGSAEVPVPGQRFWRSGEGVKSGFAHGTAGIAAALFRAAALTEDRQYATAAQEALAFERSRFREGGTNSQSAHSWCRGIPGFALALIACRDDRSGETDPELNTALQTIASCDDLGPDHLCCGNMGRAEVLFVAGQRLRREELLHEANRVASTMIGRYHEQQGFALFARDAASVPSPSLLQGTAGIGYQLLRLAFPERVPSLLLFE